MTVAVDSQASHTLPKSMCILVQKQQTTYFYNVRQLLSYQKIFWVSWQALGIGHVLLFGVISKRFSVRTVRIKPFGSVNMWFLGVFSWSKMLLSTVALFPYTCYSMGFYLLLFFVLYSWLFQQNHHFQYVETEQSYCIGHVSYSLLYLAFLFCRISYYSPS